MNNSIKYFVFSVSALSLCYVAFPAFGQTQFQNLNFEKPIKPLVMDDLGEVATSDAVPGWTVYNSGGGHAQRMIFDTVSLGEPRVSLQSSVSPWGPPIQGQYSVLLQANTFGLTTTAIGQVGQIPANAMSLRFYGRMSLEVTFEGQPLSLIQTGTGLAYDVIGADVSAFAGQTGELRFTSANIPVSTFIFLDAIRFSPAAIPEPGICALLTLGALGLGWHTRHVRPRRKAVNTQP